MLLGLVAMAWSIATPSALAQRPAGVKVRESLYVVSVYDAKRDPAADLKLAITKAQAENKRVLLDVGGDWCVWCHILDDYLGRNKTVGDAFAASFVILKVHWSPEHRNEAFLGAYPDTNGYPHFYILDASGAYLGQQDTGALEQGDSYSRIRMLYFAEQWRVK